MRLPDPDIVDYGTDPQILRSLISFYPETRNRKIKIARKVPIKKRLIYQKLIACELSLILSSIGLSDRRVLGWPTTLQLIDAPEVCISMGEVRILGRPVLIVAIGTGAAPDSSLVIVYRERCNATTRPLGLRDGVPDIRSGIDAGERIMNATLVQRRDRDSEHDGPKDPCRGRHFRSPDPASASNSIWR